MAITFKKPPLSEVALGYTFLHRPDFLIPHIGSFWTKVKDNYPTVRHAQPVLDSPEAGPFQELPLPRVWFISEDGARLIQVQQDRLIFNWRDQLVSGSTANTPYVRYPAIKAEFDRVDRLFREHIQDMTSVPVQPATYTMTYVNFLRHGEGFSSLGDIAEVFPDFSWNASDRFLPAPSLVALRLEFPLPREFGKLSVSVTPGKVSAENEPILKFELNANSGSLGGKSVDFNVWCEVAHEWIVRAFKDLTSAKMHSEYWVLERE